MRPLAPHVGQPCYCEENVWRLIRRGLEGRRAAALVITNRAETILMDHQRRAPGELVSWDYHVVLAVDQRGWAIYDEDATLPWPTPLAGWVAAAFPLGEGPGEFAPRLRVLEAQAYGRSLCSDRSHMREDGGFLEPPPPWPAPEAEDGAPRWELAALRDVERPEPGRWVGLAGLPAALEAVVGGQRGPQ